VLDLAAELDGFIDRVPDDGAPILIPDTAINSLSLVGELERRSGHPVFAANQVSLWHGLKLLGVSARIEGAGSLFG
jgi:maleate cis-trans isomerase